MPDPIWTPPKKVLVRNAIVTLDDVVGAGYMTLRPIVPPLEKRTQKEIPARLIMDYNPDGSISGVEILWEAGKLNRG